MPSIFISYAREEAGLAERLAGEFQDRGADVWWDRRLLSGERYIEAILRQVQHADYVLLLLSEHSEKSTWVAFEIGAARARELDAGQDFLCVAHVDECRVPGFIGERQATPFPHGTQKEWTGSLQALLPSLGLPWPADYKAPAGEPHESLKVFQARGQWMELIKSESGLACVLGDSGEQRARIQWFLTPEELEGCNTQVREPDPERGWSTFDLAGKHDWRWSPALFSQRGALPPKEAFEEALRELIEWRPG
jgi:hypothetical protein